MIDFVSAFYYESNWVLLTKYSRFSLLLCYRYSARKKPHSCSFNDNRTHRQGVRKDKRLPTEPTGRPHIYESPAGPVGQKKTKLEKATACLNSSSLTVCDPPREKKKTGPSLLSKGAPPVSKQSDCVILPVFRQKKKREIQ